MQESFQQTRISQEPLSQISNRKDPTIYESWPKVVDLIKSRVHLTTYKTIFSEISPLNIESGVLTIVCPSEVIKEWLKRSYYDLILKAVKHVFPEVKSIDYIVSPEIELPAQAELFNVDVMTDEPDRYPFNPKHTFDSFVVADSNEFPYAASLAVAEEPGKLYNPLFIYGGVGLGKTHLLHAIANYVYRHHRKLRVRYVTSEKFTNDFIQAVRDHAITYLHKTYREVDVLLVDDIQFLQGKEQTQEEFFHTFNVLYEAGKQIVISSDRPPRNLSALEDRLVSRFEHGLIADIHPPDLETRVAILYKKAEYQNVHLDEDVVLAIAERITSNIRELEGALNRVVAYSRFNGIPLTAELVKKLLADPFPEKASKPVSINTIQNAVCSYFNISKSDLIGSKRSSSIVYARHIAIYLARTLTDESLPTIGKYFGGRDHSTILYAYEKVCSMMEKERQTLNHINTLTRIIKESS